MTAINRGFFVSAVISLILVVAASFIYLPAKFSQLKGVTDHAILSHGGNPRWLAIGAVLIGLVLASAIQLLTGYFTETNRRPVREIGESSLTGAATVILSGISVGLESAVYSALLIGGAVYAAFLLGTGNATLALFAVALAGTGLLTTVGVIVSMDTFGPVSDNAQGIAEMSGDVEGEGAVVLTRLDAVGNTTKAITKGIAIATAVLAATALFGSFRTTVQAALGKAAGTFSLSVDRPNVLVGVMVGACVVFFFSGLLIMAVGRAARPGRLRGARAVPQPPGDHGLHREARVRPGGGHLHQGLAARTGHPGPDGGADAHRGRFRVRLRHAGRLPGRGDRGRCADGGVPRQLRRCLGQREEAGRGRATTAARARRRTPPPSSVTPSGDPFKDTAGPAINPLLKVMNLVSLLVATSVVKYSHNVGLRTGVALAAVAIVVAAVVISKRRSTSVSAGESGDAAAAVAAPGPDSAPAPRPSGDGTNGTAPAEQAQQRTP